MSRRVVLAVLGVSFSHPTSAFFVPHLRSIQGDGRRRIAFRSFALNSVLVEPGDETVPATSTGSPPDESCGEVELWLDLRGTAILPGAALSHLEDDLWGDVEALTLGRNRIVDRVLVSEANVGKALRHSDTEDPAVDVFFVRHEDGAIIDSGDQENIVGTLACLRDDEMADPIPVMDTVSRGGWALIDSDEVKDDEKKRDAVTGLVELLGAGAAIPAVSLLGGEGGDEPFDEEGKIARHGTDGGVVLCCRSKEDLLCAGALLQSSRGGSFTATDSGILVQTATSDGGSEKLLANEPPFKGAVAIPFDMNLWKAASFVFGGFGAGDLVDESIKNP